MRRLLPVLALAALLLPGASRAAACSQFDCAPSQFTLRHGTFVGYRASAHARVTVVDLRTGSAVRLPSGLVGGRLLVHGATRRVEWYDAVTGRLVGARSLPWSIRLAGVSQDGRRAVAFRSKRSLAILTTGATRIVALPPGNWDVDALRGDDLYLIRYLANGYQVRLLDLAHPRAATRLLKDPHESGTIWGSPFARLGSADGNLLFTLYIASNGAAMVHELDLAHARARCIDLPGTGDYGSATSWGLVLSPDGRTLWAASPGYGRVVAIDVASRKVVRSFTLSLPLWNLGFATRTAVSPDGTRIALANGESVAVVDLASRRVVSRVRDRALAVAWSPTTGALRTLR
jgi:hypothetical protein